MHLAHCGNLCYNHRMELIQLRQLVAIAETKVLSRAAEKLHISQPALSRSIQHLEDELGVQLFDRKKNSMSLNENGEAIVERAKIVLADTAALVSLAGALRQQKRTFYVASCAPAPLWKLTAELQGAFPGTSVKRDTVDEDSIISLLLSEKANFAITRKAIDSEAIKSIPFLDEQLFMQIPESHPLSKKSEIRFADLAGETILEYTKTGFWHKLHRNCIPDATFIEYDDFMVYMNVVKSPQTFTFVTELGHTKNESKSGCSIVPITDENATAHYRLAFLKKNEAALRTVIDWAVDAAKGW